MQRTKPATDPKAGAFPGIEYDYVNGLHIVNCACGSTCSTTDELVARNFAQRETGLHARRRIITPLPPEDL